MSPLTCAQRIELVKIVYGDERRSNWVVKIWNEIDRKESLKISHVPAGKLIEKCERIETVQDGEISGRTKSTKNIESCEGIEANSREEPMNSIRK